MTQLIAVQIAKAAMTRYATLPTKMMGYDW